MTKSLLVSSMEVFIDNNIDIGGEARGGKIRRSPVIYVQICGFYINIILSVHQVSLVYFKNSRIPEFSLHILRDDKCNTCLHGPGMKPSS